MKSRWETWSIITLELLFALCAASVVGYKMAGIFEFEYLSYRFFNIVASILIVCLIAWALLRSERQMYLYPVIALFSLFHLIEGVMIGFWYKVIIHFLILLIVAWMYLRQNILTTEKVGDRSLGAWGEDGGVPVE